MEKEISTSAMLGVTLLALAIVIGMGFSIFMVSKGATNEGTVNVTQSLEAISKQIFQDYDQKTVTGTQVLSTLTQFEGKPYAILINTKALTEGQKITNKHTNIFISSDTSNTRYVNFNTVLASDSSGASIKLTNPDDFLTKVFPQNARITDKGGNFVASFGFALESNIPLVDTTTIGLTQKGTAEYISPQTKFKSNLLKDTSGVIVGVVFKQL